jgi:superfamily II DNA or RNA helicase
MIIGTKERSKGKDLYPYQIESIDKIFTQLAENSDKEKYNLLFQLPTGGGKTVIFSEIARRFIFNRNKKVVILTHRIELCKQTSRMLNEFGVNSMVINSNVKELPEDKEYLCYVAMVETLNNRLNDEDIKIDNVGLIIVDEAHYNSFTKLFKFFKTGVMLGVTATPLSSNINQPMKGNYDHLIVGESIPSLVSKGYLAKANYYRYNVGLTSLKIGSHGDYTVSSSERLYADSGMQIKLLQAYQERALGKKTLIFNNGIKTSRQVYINFKEAGYAIEHLDNTTPQRERKRILNWLKTTPDAIVTSVSILTTGFDEPTVDCIVLNRATRSLTLYFQMIGRGSRVLPNKKEFDVIDLGNNLSRFGPWDGEVDWLKIFRNPDYYLQNIIADEDLERDFDYVMPSNLKEMFANTEDFSFNVYKAYEEVMSKGMKPHAVLEKSLEQHIVMIKENSSDLLSARQLARMLEADVAHRIKKFAHCITKSTFNYKKWLMEDYMTKLLSNCSYIDFDDN